MKTVHSFSIFQSTRKRKGTMRQRARSTRTLQRTGEGGKRDIKTGFPLLCQDSRFALASKLSGNSICAHNVEIKIREYRGLRTCLQYLFQPSLQTRRHDSFLSLHPLCFKICHRFLPFAVFKRPPNSRCVFVLCLFDPDGVTDSKILRKVWS